MPNLKFLTEQEIKNKFTTSPIWLEYNTFKNKIHECMKKIPQNSKNIHSSFQKFLLKCKGTARIRTMQEELAKGLEDLKCFKAWNLELNNNLTTQRFKKALNESMKMHLDIKIRYVQFRILHRYLGTNHQVSKFRSDIIDKCTFCEKKNGNTENKETLLDTTA